MAAMSPYWQVHLGPLIAHPGPAKKHFAAMRTKRAEKAAEKSHEGPAQDRQEQVSEMPAMPDLPLDVLIVRVQKMVAQLANVNASDEKKQQMRKWAKAQLMKQYTFNEEVSVPEETSLQRTGS
jgi:hypothetical protein